MKELQCHRLNLPEKTKERLNTDLAKITILELTQAQGHEWWPVIKKEGLSANTQKAGDHRKEGL